MKNSKNQKLNIVYLTYNLQEYEQLILTDFQIDLIKSEMHKANLKIMKKHNITIEDII